MTFLTTSLYVMSATLGLPASASTNSGGKPFALQSDAAQIVLRTVEVNADPEATRQSTERCKKGENL